MGLLSKRFVAVIAATAALGLSAAAQATPVMFTVAGAFTAGGGDTVNGSGALVDTASGSHLTLSFSNNNPFSVTTPATGVDLGEFTLKTNVPSGSEGFNALDKFTLTISQSSPSAGPQPTQTSITGTVSFTAVPNQNNQGVLHLVFLPNPVIVTAGAQQYFYKLHDLDITVGTNRPTTEIGSLTADVIAAPLPNVAGIGLSMFGGLGALSMLRRRNSVA